MSRDLTNLGQPWMVSSNISSQVTDIITRNVESSFLASSVFCLFCVRAGVLAAGLWPAPKRPLAMERAANDSYVWSWWLAIFSQPTGRD